MPTATRRSIVRWRPSLSTSIAELWETIAEAAAAESQLWAEALLPAAQREPFGIFSPLAGGRFALGLETVYEGYLSHYGTPRLFRAADRNTALLLGDYLYAHGLVRIAALEEPAAVSDLAELIALCAHVRAQNAAGDGAAWAGTASRLGEGVLSEARAALRSDLDDGRLLGLARDAAGDDAVERALAAHAARVR